MIRALILVFALLAALSDWQPSYAIPNVPAECDGMVFDNVYVLTEGNDVFKAPGHTRDLIFGLGGNDIIKGTDLTGPGDLADCIVGGTGNDKLYGYHGDDVLLGEQGDDILFGMYDSDIIWGGFGLDSIDGGTDANGSDDDKCWGEFFAYGNDYEAGEASEALSCERWWEE